LLVAERLARAGQVSEKSAAIADSLVELLVASLLDLAVAAVYDRRA